MNSPATRSARVQAPRRGRRSASARRDPRRPITLNTLTKWADGHSDTLALGLVTEALGLELPLVALPYINRAQAAHPALARGVSLLRECGVTVLLGEGGFIPHEPKHGDVDAYPWDAALAALPTPRKANG
ncbi:hypothetical protein [Streptomyces sp. UG1]|uniref:hypothetical protein n=1 Tax=Streptomyces sp. UG1 TaxID=3417652 RepID=UPI003CEC183F